MKKIGIIGSGVVAKTLGTGFIKHGYDVMLGSRDISKLEEWKNQNSGKTGSMEEAAKHGNIIVLATKGSANEEAINIMGCLLYTSPSPRDRTRSRMPSSA